MSIVSLAVKRPVTVFMFTVAIILFGIVGLTRLPVSLLPNLSHPSLTIRSLNVGAAPAEIEQRLSKPIEEAIGTIKGIRKIQSLSKSGQSDVIVTFEWGIAMNIAIQNIREKLDLLALPKEVNKPMILRFNPSLDPIFRLALSTKSTKSKSLKQARIFAEQEIKREIQSLSGVAAVQLGGGYQQEIQVIFDQEKAANFGISAEDIVSRIKNENINMSAGRVYDGHQEYLVRTVNQFDSLNALKNIIVKQSTNHVVYLKEIAEIIDGEKERTDITRINNNEAIELAVYKEGDANTVTVARAINKKIAELQNRLPKKLKLSVVYDQSTFIINAINEVKNSALIGGMLAMLILYLFLGRLSNTLIISLAIPISIIATFNLMFSYDISLNIMSLGGIALAIGLLVDNSIVVLENINRLREQGKNRIDAAILGCQEVSGAVTASTLTTLAVFFPLAFIDGFAGQLFHDQALTVTFSLLVSLIIALTLIPMLSSRKILLNTDLDSGGAQQKPNRKVFNTAKVSKHLQIFNTITYITLLPLKLFFSYFPMLVLKILLLLINIINKLIIFILEPLHLKFTLLFKNISDLYKKVLIKSLIFPRTTILMCIVFAITVISLVSNIGGELMPEVKQKKFTIELNLPQGTPINITDQRLQQLANSVAKNPRIKYTYSLAGSGSLMMSSANKGGENWGQLLVVLQNSADMNDIKNIIRAQVKTMPDVSVKIKQTELLTKARPLQIILSAYNLEQLKKASDRLASLLIADKQFVDINNSLRAGQPELKIIFDHQRLASLGLKTSTISKQLLTKISGSIASKYNLEDRQIDILVRVNKEARSSVQAIKQMMFNTKQNKSLPLTSIARIEQTFGPNEINRIDQNRVAIVSASLAYGDLASAVKKVNKILRVLPMPTTIKIKVAGQNEEMNRAFSSLIYALLLAIFLVYLVMASQFESLLNPLIILLSVPLAMLGALLGLYISNTNISAIVLIGMIMLTGIAVNNAIVLIDKINQLRQKGFDKIEAIKATCELRFRPIMMTSLTTILGLAPLAFSSGEGAELRAPLAITVISGLVVATILTLVIIPVLYLLFDRKCYVRKPNNSQSQTINLSHGVNHEC